MSAEKKVVIAERLKSKYSYDKLFAGHDTVVEEKEKTIESVKKRQGKKYILDFNGTGFGFE